MIILLLGPIKARNFVKDMKVPNFSISFRLFLRVPPFFIESFLCEHTSGDHKRWRKFYFQSFWLLLCQLRSALAANSLFSPKSCTSLCGHSACVWASLQCRHLCFAACFPQHTALWCALISCYTLGAIVPSCCKLIYVPLTLFSARFNTPNRTENSFWGLV